MGMAARWKRGILAGAFTASLLLATGCPKHEQFPTELELVTSPTPTDFVITALPRSPGEDYDYDLNWSISDATNVDYYRVYLVGAGLAPELVMEWDTTSLPITLPFDAEGLQFGLSSVSTGFVESGMTVATIPPVPIVN